ncbi:hypothetical protein E1A91_A09G034800v1 [Gossypium mustelinum]|uniref:Uncharacterized protein n=1 Tax=Gossypium mustelinum TaxID=34275 RepID=A0A5D2XU86_GOSMU|nr:hypothetical protein E1A91_A09G034800v1 [Gossypium mustelinum]
MVRFSVFITDYKCLFSICLFLLGFLQVAMADSGMVVFGARGAGHRTATGGSPAPAPATAHGGRKRWPWPTVAWWCSAQVGKWASGG